MKALSPEKLKKVLNVSHLDGTPDQIRILAVRVGELINLNGHAWVEAQAPQLLAQWALILERNSERGATMSEEARAHVIIHGRVQGVFFRYETQRAAERIGVCGWVRNQADGTVEAVFEGPSEKVDQAIEWCWKGSPLSQVTDVKVEKEAPSGDFKSFSITY
ncbi:MAG: acylphosphatase [Desulfobacteraceae bacterium]|jgi:acylphosphatase